jgi:hypothetical protein
VSGGVEHLCDASEQSIILCRMGHGLG